MDPFYEEDSEMQHVSRGGWKEGEKCLGNMFNTTPWGWHPNPLQLYPAWALLGLCILLFKNHLARTTNKQRIH